MTELIKHTFPVILMMFMLSLYIFIAPTLATNMESIKTELSDGSSASSNNVNGIGGGSNAATLFGNRRNLRSIYGLGPKMLQISRSKIPIELDLLIENEDSDRSKRFDDYGHMRFGKRGGEEQFDDYGHMRFGRST